MFFKFIYYIYVIFIFIPSVAFSLETHPQDLVDNCKVEMSETQFGSGCLTLGIVAQKVNHMDLYNKIEGLCVNHYKFRTSSNDEDLETLLEYYPQCFYVFKHKTLQKELVKFDSEVELKTLVKVFEQLIGQMSYKLAFKKEFELIEPIGKGVSSEVYRGLRVDSESEFSQVVAIKVFKSHKFRKKFQNELKNLSKINHANIVSVKDWGEKDEKFYLVTEYIHGKDLSEILGLIDPQDLKLKRYILNQIFNGIKELKNKGIAHGDLKPSNIMLSVTGELKLVDISFDDLGQVFATPEFTAPEVLTGLSVTFESDLYSLGVISQKVGTDSEKLLALEPGDRRFDLFKGVDDFTEKKKLSELIRSSFAFSVEAPEVTFESTQELRAEVVPYVGVRPTKSFKMNSLKHFVLHLFLFILLSLGFTPKYPEVKVLKLRSLNAYELWTENQWVSLPIDVVHFETIYNPMQKLKFRNLNGEFTMNISPTLDLSKNIIVDAH